MLNTQYRMHPLIAEFSSRQFYDGKLRDGVTDKDRDLPEGFPWPNNLHPVAFVPSIGSEYSNGPSKSNPEEVKLVIKIINILITAICCYLFDWHYNCCLPQRKCLPRTLASLRPTSRR